VLDIVKPVVSLMIRAQAVNLPPWKIVTWYSRVKESLERCEAELKKVEAGSKPCKKFLPKLLEHWEEIFDTEEEDEDERQPGTFQVCTVFSLSRSSNFGYKVRQPPGMQKK
jgi:hypothetical protein